MSFLALALAASLSGAGPDPAADNEKDLRCIALIAMIIPQAEGEAKSGLVGRTPAYDFEGNLNRVLQSKPDLTADQQRCGDILTQKGNQLIAIGKRNSG